MAGPLTHTHTGSHTLTHSLTVPLSFSTHMYTYTSEKGKNVGLEKIFKLMHLISGCILFTTSYPVKELTLPLFLPPSLPTSLFLPFFL